MNRKRRKLFVLLTILCLLVGQLAWWLHREIQHEGDNAALIAAIKKNDTDAALNALERGADANAFDTGDYQQSIGQRLSQLWARLIGHKVQDGAADKPTAILLLFTRKTDVYGTPPPENAQVLKVLLDRGADPNSKKDGQTLLLLAGKYAYTASVRLLLDRGAQVNANIDGHGSVLHFLQERYSQQMLMGDPLGYPTAETNQSKVVSNLFEQQTAILRLLKQYGAK